MSRMLWHVKHLQMAVIILFLVVVLSASKRVDQKKLTNGLKLKQTQERAVKDNNEDLEVYLKVAPRSEQKKADEAKAAAEKAAADQEAADKAAQEEYNRLRNEMLKKWLDDQAEENRKRQEAAEQSKRKGDDNDGSSKKHKSRSMERAMVDGGAAKQFDKAAGIQVQDPGKSSWLLWGGIAIMSLTVIFALIGCGFLWIRQSDDAGEPENSSSSVGSDPQQQPI